MAFLLSFHLSDGSDIVRASCITCCGALLRFNIIQGCYSYIYLYIRSPVIGNKELVILPLTFHIGFGKKKQHFSNNNNGNGCTIFQFKKVRPTGTVKQFPEPRSGSACRHTILDYRCDQ